MRPKRKASAADQGSAKALASEASKLAKGSQKGNKDTLMALVLILGRLVLMNARELADLTAS
eukprot:6629478-Pyramimonas_sp.AAC.1